MVDQGKFETHDEGDGLEIQTFVGSSTVPARNELHIKTTVLFKWHAHYGGLSHSGT